MGKLKIVRNFLRTMQTKRASYTKSQLATEPVDEAGQEVLSGLDVIRMRQGQTLCNAIIISETKLGRIMENMGF